MSSAIKSAAQLGTKIAPFFENPLVSIGVGLLGSVLASKFLGPKASSPVGSVGPTSIPDTGQLQTGTGEDNWIPKQYGDRRAGMILIANTVADLDGQNYRVVDEGEYAINVYALGEGPYQKIKQLYYYDNAIFKENANIGFGTEYSEGDNVYSDHGKNNIAIEFVQGTIGQGRPPILGYVRNADGTPWFLDTDVGKGICYMVVRLKRDREALITDPSPTTFTIDTLGKQIPEIRLFGSPVQYSDATYNTGTNPALIALDQIRDVNYGAGIPDANIDFDAFVDLANYCDEQNFTLNGQFSQGDTLQNILQEISICTGAIFTDENGIITTKLFKKEISTTTVAITQSNVIGGITRIEPKTSDLPNVVRTKFISPIGAETISVVEMPESVITNERRKEIELDLRLVNTKEQADELAKRYLLNARQPIIQFEMNNEGYDLELFGIANIEDMLDTDIIANGSKVRIEGFTKERIQQSSNTAPIKVQARLYSDQIFDDTPRAVNPVLNISDAPGTNSLPIPTEVTITQSSRGGASISFREYTSFQTEISYRNFLDGSSAEFDFDKTVAAAPTIVTLPVSGQYQFRLRYVNSLGIKGPFYSSGYVTLTASGLELIDGVLVDPNNPGAGSTFNKRFAQLRYSELPDGTNLQEDLGSAKEIQEVAYTDTQRSNVVVSTTGNNEKLKIQIPTAASSGADTGTKEVQTISYLNQTKSNTVFVEAGLNRKYSITMTNSAVSSTLLGTIATYSFDPDLSNIVYGGNISNQAFAREANVTEMLTQIKGEIESLSPNITVSSPIMLSTVSKINIDLGTTTNINASYSIIQNSGTIGGGLNSVQNGTPAITVGSPSIYTVKDLEGNPIGTPFNSSVNSLAGSDIGAVKTAVQNLVNNNTQTPVNFNTTDNTENSQLVFTSENSVNVTGLFDVEVDHPVFNGTGTIPKNHNYQITVDVSSVNFPNPVPTSNNGDITLDFYTTTGYSSESISIRWSNVPTTYINATQFVQALSGSSINTSITSSEISDITYDGTNIIFTVTDLPSNISYSAFEWLAPGTFIATYLNVDYSFSFPDGEGNIILGEATESIQGNPPGVKEIQESVYTGTRSNVMTSTGNNEFAKIGINTNAVSGDGDATTILTDTNYSLSLDLSGATFPITLDSGQPFSFRYKNNISFGLLSGTAPTWNSTTTVNNANDLVNLLVTEGDLGDISQSLSNPTNSGSGVISYTYRASNSFITGLLQTFLTDTANRIEFVSPITTVKYELPHAALSVSVPLSNWSYDPDTSNTVYSTSVPTTDFTASQTATQMVTTIGNTLAGLETNITWDGTVHDQAASTTNIVDTDDEIMVYSAALNSEIFTMRRTDSGTIQGNETYWRGLTVAGDTINIGSGTAELRMHNGQNPFYGVNSGDTPQTVSVATTGYTAVTAGDALNLPGDAAQKYINIDLGTQTNIGQSLTITSNGGTNLTASDYELLETDGVSGSETGTATTYILRDYDNNQSTQFTSSVTTSAGSDLTTVTNNISSSITNNSETPTDFNGENDTGNSKIIATATTSGAVSGTWSISVNNHSQVTNPGNINFNSSSDFDGTFSNFTETRNGASDVVVQPTWAFNPDINKTVYDLSIDTTSFLPDRSSTQLLTIIGTNIAALDSKITWDNNVVTDGLNKYIIIDLGTESNISPSLTITENDGNSLSASDITTIETNGVFTNVVGVSSTYVLTSPDGNVHSSINSSVATTSESDISNIMTTFSNFVSNTTESPVDWSGSNDTANDKLIISAETKNYINGLWTITANHNGQTTNAGNVVLGVFTKTTIGVGEPLYFGVRSTDFNTDTFPTTKGSYAWVPGSATLDTITTPGYRLITKRKPEFSMTTNPLPSSFIAITNNLIDLDDFAPFETIQNAEIYTPAGTPLVGAFPVYDPDNTRYVISRPIDNAGGLPSTPVSGNTVFINSATFIDGGVTFTKDNFYRYNGTTWNTSI